MVGIHEWVAAPAQPSQPASQGPLSPHFSAPLTLIVEPAAIGCMGCQPPTSFPLHSHHHSPCWSTQYLLSTTTRFALDKALEESICSCFSSLHHFPGLGLFILSTPSFESSPVLTSASADTPIASCDTAKACAIGVYPLEELYIVSGWHRGHRMQWRQSSLPVEDRWMGP